MGLDGFEFIPGVSKAGLLKTKEKGGLHSEYLGVSTAIKRVS